MLSTVLWALLVVVLVFGSLALLRANRLDRLHVRTDAAYAALLTALERRAVVVRGIAVTLPPERAAPLRAAADAAERAAPPDREAAENELTACLVEHVGSAAGPPAGLPGGLADELADAQQRVVLARRVYNDAVRDTLALRRSRPVRWLRLAGTAAAPRYFEINEDGMAEQPASAATVRSAARVLLLDESGRVLLFEGFDPAEPDERFWFTVGGAIDGAERPRDAALRELAEETGLQLTEHELVGPVWQREVVFSFDSTSYAAHELFFVAMAAGLTVDTSGFEQIEQDTVVGHRWWSAGELATTEETIYPVQLAELLPELTAGWDGTLRTIQ